MARLITDQTRDFATIVTNAVERLVAVYRTEMSMLINEMSSRRRAASSSSLLRATPSVSMSLPYDKTVSMPVEALRALMSTSRAPVRRSGGDDASALLEVSSNEDSSSLSESD